MNVDREAIRERLAAVVSDAPWIVRIEGGIDPDGEGWSQVEIDFNTSDRAGPGLMMGSYDGDSADAEFIAHAREDIPALLAALDSALAEVERLRNICPCGCGNPRVEYQRGALSDRLVGGEQTP